MRPTKKWERRDKKHARRRHGMRVDGRSVLLLEWIIKRRAIRPKKPKLNK